VIFVPIQFIALHVQDLGKYGYNCGGVGATEIALEVARHQIQLERCVGKTKIMKMCGF
jgi:hypothetical protein